MDRILLTVNKISGTREYTTIYYVVLLLVEIRYDRKLSRADHQVKLLQKMVSDHLGHMWLWFESVN